MWQFFSSIVFFALVLVGVAVWLVTLFRKSPYTVPQTCVYFFSLLLSRFLWRADTPTELPIPGDQGAVIVANHRSSVDPFFLQRPARRVIHWMVAVDLKTNRFVESFLKFCQIIPVRRSGRDMAATKRAIRIAAEGGLVGIFPEGRINRTQDFMLPVLPGAIAIAIKGRVPVIPVYIQGSPYKDSLLSPLTMTARVKVRIGPPIYLDEYHDRLDDRSVLQEATERCIQAIAELAGNDQHVVQFTGRPKNKPETNSSLRAS